MIMRTMLGFMLLFAAATAVFYALHCLYVIFGYRQGNVATATAKLTNHSIRRRWYDRKRWYDVNWTGYIYSYTVGGKEYQIKGGIYAGGDSLPGTVKIAYQCSDPNCSFIPVLKGPAQMQAILVCMVSAAAAFALAGRLLIM